MSEQTQSLLEEARGIHSFLEYSLDAMMERYDGIEKVMYNIVDSLADISKSLDKFAEATGDSKKTMASNAAAAGESGSKAGAGTTATKNTIDLSGLKDIAASLPQLTTGLIMFKVAGQPGKFTAFIRDLTNAVTLDGKLQDAAAVSSMFKAVTTIFKELGDNITPIAKGVSLFEKTDPFKFTAFIRSITNAMTLDGKVQKPEEISKLYTSMSTVIDSLGSNISKMSVGLMLFSMADKMNGPKKFIDFISDFMSKDRMKDLNPEKADKVGKALDTISGGIFKFSLAAAASTPLLLIGIPGLMLLSPVLALTTIAMDKIGKDKDKSKDANMSMMYIAGAIGVFTLALFATRILTPTDLLMGVGLVAVFSLFAVSMAMINKIGGGKAVEDSSKAMVGFSVALGVMALSVILMKYVEPADLMKSAVLVAIFGGAAFILGKAKDTAKDGALALVAIAGAVAVATLSVMLMKFVEPADLIKASVLMVGLGGAALLLGLAKNVANSGAVILIAIAGSLLIATFSVMLLKSVSWEDIGKAGAIIGGLTAATIALGIAAPLAILGAASLLVISVSMIVAAFGIKMLSTVTDEQVERVNNVVNNVAISSFSLLGLAAILIIPGAAALIMVSVSMIFLAAGMAIMNKVDLNKTNPETMSNLLDSLGSSYAWLGLKSPLILLGAASMVVIGVSLITIGSGLLLFSKLNVPLDKLTGEDGLINKVITAVARPFAEIGKGNMTDENSPVSRGIRAVQGVGDVLVGIAKGVQEFANLTYVDSKGNRVQLTTAAMETVSTNMKMVIGAVGSSFAEIGMTNGNVEWFKYDMIKKGVESVSGVGDNLVSIAKATQDFANLTFIGSDGKRVNMTKDQLVLVGDNIKTMIMSITSALGEIGANPNADRGWWFGKSNIEKGMNAIKGVGNNLGSIVNVVKGVSDLIGKKINMDAVAVSLKKMISSTIAPFTDKKIIGDMTKVGDDIDIINKSMGVISDVSMKAFGIFDAYSKHKNFDASYPKLMNTLVTSFSKFSSLEMTKSDSFTKIGETIINIANKNSELTKSASAIEKIGNSFEKTFNAMGKLADDKIKKVDELFTKIVKIDEYNNEKLGRTIDNMSIAKQGGNIGGGNSGGDSNAINELRSEIQMINKNMESMLMVLNKISMSLNKTLSVEIEGGDINRYIYK